MYLCYVKEYMHSSIHRTSMVVHIIFNVACACTTCTDHLSTPCIHIFTSADVIQHASVWFITVINGGNALLQNEVWCAACQSGALHHGYTHRVRAVQPKYCKEQHVFLAHASVHAHACSTKCKQHVYALMHTFPCCGRIWRYAHAAKTQQCTSRMHAIAHERMPSATCMPPDVSSTLVRV